MGAIEYRDRYEGALLFSTVGNALAWPTEFAKLGNNAVPLQLPLTEYVQWRKKIGGYWWGYEETIKPGQYSDDIQLTLAVSRCIDDYGAFEPERFAYLELPLWLHYEMGGGRALKTAARSLVSAYADWTHNFFKKENLDYVNAGSNGAAMRNLPIALVNIDNEARLVRDSIYNALITHGHPRAIIGTVLFGAAVHYVLTSPNHDARKMLFHLDTFLEHSKLMVKQDGLIKGWIEEWEKRAASLIDFQTLFGDTIDETRKMLDLIEKYLALSEKEYYLMIGALDPATKGSGTGTVCAAIYLFLKKYDKPEEAIYTAANLIGSDTDTIATFLGALLGSAFGQNAIPRHLKDRLQDNSYLVETARRLYDISTKNIGDKTRQNTAMEKKEAFQNILAWEVGLHEMFWDTVSTGSIIVHPTLGRGTIARKEVKPIKRAGYVAKLLGVNFDSGQTCTFRSRVKDDQVVLESLARDVHRGIYQKL